MSDGVLDALTEIHAAFRSRGLPLPVSITLPGELRTRLEWEISQMESYQTGEPKVMTSVMGIPILFADPVHPHRVIYG